jgi:hypothetical protein
MRMNASVNCSFLRETRGFLQLLAYTPLTASNSLYEDTENESKWETMTIEVKDIRVVCCGMIF